MVVLMDPDAQRNQQDALRKHRSSERRYLFDAAFGSDSTQAEVYERTCQPLVKAVLEGYNACVFAYGATGGGKTYTMVGNQQDPGCMVRALNELFNEMELNNDFVFKACLNIYWSFKS